MSRTLIVRPEAEADIFGAFRWYEDQVPGLGEEFLKALDDTFQRIEQAPELYTRVHRDLRRALSPRFPFSVFYVIGNDGIVVVAVLHTARDPRIWRRRFQLRG